jgi:multicomponent Na+:H+ antiporter subunit E
LSGAQEPRAQARGVLGVSIAGRVVQLPPVLWLTGVWMLLWGSVRLSVVLSGLALAVALCFFAPLPPLDAVPRPRPLGVARLAVFLTADLAWSSLRVTWRIVTPGAPRPAVVQVALRARSDLMNTLTALAVTAVPGSAVVDLRRADRVMTVHVLDLDGPGAAARARAGVLRTEQLIVDAFGGRADLARVRGGDGGAIGRPDADGAARGEGTEGGGAR